MESQFDSRKFFDSLLKTTEEAGLLSEETKNNIQSIFDQYAHFSQTSDLGSFQKKTEKEFKDKQEERFPVCLNIFPHIQEWKDRDACYVRDPSNIPKGWFIMSFGFVKELLNHNEYRQGLEVLMALGHCPSNDSPVNHPLKKEDLK